MALPNRSTGSTLIGSVVGFHDKSTAMTPRLLNALIQNGAATPRTVAVPPPRADPTARLTFMPALFAAIAEDKSLLGTSCGTTACQAGDVSVTAVLLRKVKTKILVGVVRSRQTTTANSVAVIVTQISPISRNVRLSVMSASAPAGTANKNIGRVAA